MYNLEKFPKADMCRRAVTLRNMDAHAECMEDTANAIVRYIYDNFLKTDTAQPACTLVRFFKTHSYANLGAELQQAAQQMLPGQAIPSRTKCLTLMATVGDEPKWNARTSSAGHQAIPLIDEDFVTKAPMILQLIQQFGLDISTVVSPTTTLITDAPHKAFNVFYIPKALNSPYIPAQQQFVKPYGVKSVLGFGGMLPTGELFAVILFRKVAIPRETADAFRWISAYVRIAVEGFTRESTFAHQKTPALL